jgi:DNA-binding MarR family transcriptional regulator
VTTGGPAVEPDDIRRVETQLGALLRRTSAFVAASAVDVHPELGATGYVMLARLLDAGPMRASELVEIVDTDKATISRQITHLEQVGLVSREPDPTDRRAQTISVTAEGRRRLQAARRRNQRRLRAGLGEWDPADVRELGLLLEKFNALQLD